jgi:hypothetical protein
MADLLTHEKAWTRITALVSKQPGNCQVAVAYFGDGASNLLPLGKGSTLVVDASERAVRSGQTKPSEIWKLVQKGVDAYSVQNLHAKVFVIGRKALVGSANVSNSSAGRLIEAVLEIDDRSVASACRQFIMNLRAEPLTLWYLARLQKLWLPPKFGAGVRKPQKNSKIIPRHPPLWSMSMVPTTYDSDAEKAMNRGHIKAKPRLRSPRLFHIDDFMLEGSVWIDPVRRNDLAMVVLDEGGGVTMVSQPARILDIEAYQKGRRRFAIASVEVSKTARRKSLERVLEALPPSGKILKESGRPVRVRDPLLAHALMNLWAPK